MDWEDHKEVFINFWLTFGLPVIGVWGFYQLGPIYFPVVYKIVATGFALIAPLSYIIYAFIQRSESKRHERNRESARVWRRNKAKRFENQMPSLELNKEILFKKKEDL